MPTMLNALARLLPRSGPIPAVLNAARHAMKPEEKASRTGPLIALETLGRPVWTPRDYHSFAREGFQQNAIVYRAVRLISEAAASVPWLLYEDESDLSDHPLLDLLAQPSPDQTTTDFLEAWYGYLLVSGNAYVEAVGLNGKLRELHALRPDRMKVIPGEDGWPEAYEYTAAGQSIVFEDEPVHGVRPILHVKLFHPANDHYGMSPIEAASVAIDTHNTAAQWNKALLDNSARPSGALVYGGMDGRMTQDQFDRLKSELETTYQGAAHAGRPLLLEGGLDWKPLSLSPKDMDYYEARNSAAREIALALGVPPMLLGIPGDNTYANYQEAQRALWRNTVLPLVNRTAKAFTGWLTPAYADNLVLKPDLDQVEALTIEREALWARIDGVSFLTPNEKREAVGYAALEEFEPAPPVATPEPASTAIDFDPPTNFEDDNPFEVDDTKWLSKTSARECTAPVAVWATEGARKERTAAVARGAAECGHPKAPRNNTKRFDPNQPRAPAGSSTGGQWVDGAGGGSGSASDASRKKPTRRQRPHDDDDHDSAVASRRRRANDDPAAEAPTKDRLRTEDDDRSTLRDAIEEEGLDLDALNADVAAETRLLTSQAGSSNQPNRPIRTTLPARFQNATVRQEVEYNIARGHKTNAMARARRVNPNYKAPTLAGPNPPTIESQIAKFRAQAKHAERFIRDTFRGKLGGVPQQFRAPRSETLESVCRPGGKLIGRAGGGGDTTTVRRSTFTDLVRRLTSGAKEIPARRDYNGQWYRRSDGTVIGIRRSNRHGLTLDIVNSKNNPGLKQGTRIHFND